MAFSPSLFPTTSTVEPQGVAPPHIKISQAIEFGCLPLYVLNFEKNGSKVNLHKVCVTSNWHRINLGILFAFYSLCHFYEFRSWFLCQLNYCGLSSRVTCCYKFTIRISRVIRIQRFHVMWRIDGDMTLDSKTSCKWGGGSFTIYSWRNWRGQHLGQQFGWLLLYSSHGVWL